jgi:hypothetical protein
LKNTVPKIKRSRQPGNADGGNIQAGIKEALQELEEGNSVKAYNILKSLVPA